MFGKPLDFALYLLMPAAMVVAVLAVVGLLEGINWWDDDTDKTFPSPDTSEDQLLGKLPETTNSQPDNTTSVAPVLATLSPPNTAPPNSKKPSTTAPPPGNAPPFVPRKLSLAVPGEPLPTTATEESFSSVESLSPITEEPSSPLGVSADPSLAECCSFDEDDIVSATVDEDDNVSATVDEGGGGDVLPQ